MYKLLLYDITSKKCLLKDYYFDNYKRLSEISLCITLVLLIFMLNI